MFRDNDRSSTNRSKKDRKESLGGVGIKWRELAEYGQDKNRERKDFGSGKFNQGL